MENTTRCTWGVMRLIMECCIPFKVPAVYLIVLTQKFHPAPQQCLPLCSTVISKSFCILSPQADDIGPYHSRMICHLLCHTEQYNRFPLIRKQTMSTYSFYSWSVCKVIYVIFLLGNNIRIVFQCLRDKLCRILPCWPLEIIKYSCMRSASSIFDRMSAISSFCLTVAGSKPKVLSIFSTPSRVLI